MTATRERLKQAMQFQLQDQSAKAEPIYLEILAAAPDNADANHLLGLIRAEQDRHDEAIALIEKAIGSNARAAVFHHNLAGIYQCTGRLVEAEAEFREAIRLKADYGEAYQGLAEIVKFDPDNPLLAAIEQQLANPSLPDAVKSFFHFAAGKISDDIGRFDAAFGHYLAGNRLAGKAFDRARCREQTKEILYRYSARHRDRSNAGGSASEIPVFIVGMPRSGSTLVEQILASHGGVFGAGELNEMNRIARLAVTLTGERASFPACIEPLGPEHYEQLANAYLEALARHCEISSYRRVIDKHPLNYQYVGLILDMFPRARIIHTVRNPLDTCLSCFFQNFSQGQTYSFDLTNLAHFYNDYRRLMEHWQTLYPERILSVEYETLLQDQEAQSRRMLDFLGLPFEEGCLRFFDTDRVVKTASFCQVRQPLYQTSRNRWHNYRQHLADFARIIGIDIEAQ